MSWHVRVIRNRYADSVRLMAVARDVRAGENVAACEIGIGTPANLKALAAMGARADAGPSDVVIAVRAEGGAAEEALDQAEERLTSDGAGGPPAGGALPEPRSLPAAAARVDGANVALVSVPGPYAALAAHQALTRGMHAFVFSDHVPVDAEIELKRRAAERGLLVMGPECGTAMLGEFGLGFSNVVPRGDVGIVAAAGTGAQEAACLLNDAGSGVSHIIGVGGRDLSAEVGGIMFREGIRRLAADDETETLLLVSKPPDPEVVSGLRDVLPGDKRVVAVLLGRSAGGGDDAGLPVEVYETLEAGACAAAGADPPAVGDLERQVDELSASTRGGGRRVLGLFSGGSLATEAETVLAAAGADREVLDLGDEEYTQGRPHPMVDLSLRVEMLERAAADASVGCMLVDVVLGRAAHPDPAAELVPPLARLAERVPVVACVCGTRGDPQDAARQTEALRDAGVLVAPSGAAAARLAARAVGAAVEAA